MKKFIIKYGIFTLLLFSIIKGYAQTDKVLHFTITQPNQIIISSVPSNPTAFGLTDGFINITPNDNGNTPYAYEWVKNPSTTIISTSQNLLNVGAGSYTLTIKDVNYANANPSNNVGCTFSQTFVLTEPPELTVSITQQQNILCFGDNSGSLIANSNGGGVGTYTYIWYRVTGGGLMDIMQNTQIATNLSPGIYRVSITDRAGTGITKWSSNFNLSQPNQLTFTTQKQNISCNGANDGSITIIPQGGTIYPPFQPYLYKMLGETMFTTSNTRIGLNAGTYFFTVKDANGCETNNFSSGGITILEPTNIVITLSSISFPSSNGATDASINVAVSGGTSPPYIYQWKDEFGTVIGTSEDILGIGAGTYTLTVTDVNNCVEVSQPIVITEPQPLIVEILENSPISCNSANVYNNPYSDGVLIANGDGGVPLDTNVNNGLPYYFTWKKLNDFGVWVILTTQITNLATELSAGQYAVFVTDANGNVSPEVTFILEEPLLLNIDFDKQDVYCIEGNDAWINVSIYDGTPSITGEYNIQWYNTNDPNTIIGSNTLIEGLEAGNYTVSITDERGCQIEGSIDVFEPNNPITVIYTAFNPPSSNVTSDAWVEAQIEGGTPNIDGSYYFDWSDNMGNILNSQVTLDFVGASNNIFQLRLNNITSGTYYLTIYDANYNDASSKEGCISETEYVINEPIEAEIVVYHPISCNQENTFNNPFSDGQLIATVTGGVPFTNGLPYIYHWKKEDENGIYIDLPTQNNEIAINLFSGNYALNVEDSLGNIIGIYQEGIILEPIDVLFTFNEPDLLEINFETTPISCEIGNDGTIASTITGGIAPYDIQWSNGESLTALENLISGTYIAYVTDAIGCEVTGQITVEQPGGIEITIINQSNPTCFEGNDGYIEIEVNGGQEPLTYQWEDTNNTTTLIENLSEGTYTIHIIDSNNCNAYKTIELENPDPITVELGEDTTLCLNQDLELNIQIDDQDATYLWESDFGFNNTNANILITQAGTYTATVTSGLGCVGSDTIIIETNSSSINAEFLLTTQAFAEEDVILINTSNPISSEVAWIVPDDVQIIEQSNETITLRFDFEGIYEISLRSFQGDCTADYSKTIIVEEARELPDIGDADNPFITNFSAYPNPTTGEFTTSIMLAEPASISLRLYNLISNVPIDDRQVSGNNEYNINYNMNLPFGVYFLLLETPNGSEIRKIIIE